MREPTEDRSGRLERIVAEHGAALARLAAVYAADTAARDDLLQEILLAVWRALPAFRGECSERTFVFRIAHNRGLTLRSRTRRHARIDELDDLPDPRPGPEAQLQRSQAQERLLTAVRGLPAAQGQVVMLHLEGFTHGEIAEVLGLSENNVAVRLTRARAALRQQLAPERIAP